MKNIKRYFSFSSPGNNGMPGRGKMPVLLIVTALLLMRATQSGNGPAESGDPVTIALTTIAGLQYDKARFHVKPGARVRIILTNKDDMSHNLVITKKEKRLDVVNAAMKLDEKGPAVDYIPESSDVLWSIRVLSPGESASITFTAPREEGVYPYVCTFPGHGFSMYGAMYVNDDGKMPELSKDKNIPESRREEKGGTAAHAGHMPRAHPYEPEAPFLYRAYMPDSGPASVAVHLPGDLSYCWDTEVCELRYAWQGGFVDNTAFWKGKPNAEPKIVGTVFYRNRIDKPLRIGNQKALTIDFLGYRLVDRYPEFHYRLNGTDVYELVREADGGEGLIRTFRVSDVKDEIRFYTDARDGMKYTSTAGTWENGTLRIPAKNAAEFSVVMTKRGGN